nr:NADH dehydrogenase subunit 2 [Tachydromia umbrarum]
MFNNSSKILFFFILFSGTFITISATSWLSAWMGLEINLLAFIPLMNNTQNMMSTEASLKYFLTQALASSTLLFLMILFMMKFNMFFQMNTESIYLNILIMSTLLLKSGTAPFHFWFPEVMEGLSWINAMILMTWQKIAPLILISYLNIMNNSFFFIMIILSSFIGAIGGFNQTSVKKIMAFSSINHLSWILTAMLNNNTLWINYFLFYSFLSSNLVMFFYMFQIININQLFSMTSHSKLLNIFMFTNFLSLGGLPPFLGFLPKWMVIKELMTNNQLFLMFMLIIFSLITLFFYLRMCYTTFLLNSYTPNWMNYQNFSMNNNLIYIYSIMSTLSTTGLLLTPYFYLY